jgi:hypothetical protein
MEHGTLLHRGCRLDEVLSSWRQESWLAARASFHLQFRLWTSIY